MTVNAINSTAAAPAAKAKNSLADLDSGDFIKLMTAQLKQQDPTNPTDNSEMLAQMAQFSSLASTTKSGETLDAIAKKLDAVVSAQNATAAAIAKLAENQTKPA
ncbi:flagellar hook assembly protein FlgD [Novosphingobium kaempferiae]|uniref:flagellar hook assembly protein FlgD n=1 Tax=Novosphingobium kaempferiae TaxID=2896849 RepID=UPI001E5D4BA0|nr:flagellar hook capping FlgD N-terminal domain-containing protein [Novosphingobium kaempferiae]